MTLFGLKQWLTRFRLLGLPVPTLAIIGNRKPDILEAIITLDHVGTCTGKGVHPGPGEPQVGVHSGPGEPQVQGAGVHPGPLPDMGILVACDSTAAPVCVRRKMHRKWSKLCRKAVRKTKRVFNTLQATLQEHPDATISLLRAEVGKKIGVTLEGKYKLVFDRALLKLTAKPVAKTRARESRFVLAVRRRR